jgi:hypothetical protein
MHVTIKLDERLRVKIGGEAEFSVEAVTIHEALFEVAVLYPALHLFNCDGELRSTLRIALNGAPGAVTQSVGDGDTIELSIG